MGKQKEPQAILITGASSGIGAALARHYAGPGVTLFLSGRNSERLDRVVKLCREQGAEVETAVLCVTDRVAMAAWIRRCDEHRPVDLVVANAGISGGTEGQQAVAYGEAPEQVRQIFATNLTGTLNTIEPVIPLMVARGRGQIALMGSLASFSGWPGAPSYSASKGAVRLYGEALRCALSESGVAVNVVLPGFVKTPMTDVNNYPMPFLIDDTKAAAKIAAGLARNRGRIAFPLATYFLAGLVGILPYVVSGYLLKKMPEKPAVKD